MKDHFNFEVMSGIGCYEERIVKILGKENISRGEWMKFAGYEKDIRKFTKMGESEQADQFSMIAMENTDFARVKGIHNFHRHVITEGNGVIAALGSFTNRLECLYMVNDLGLIAEGLVKGDELAVVGGKMVKFDAAVHACKVGVFAGEDADENIAYVVLHEPKVMYDISQLNGVTATGSEIGGDVTITIVYPTPIDSNLQVWKSDRTILSEDPLPEGTTVSALTYNGDPVPVSEIDLGGRTEVFLSELVDDSVPTRGSVHLEAGVTAVWVVTITNTNPIDTNIYAQAVVSNDDFITHKVLAETDPIAIVLA